MRAGCNTLAPYDENPPNLAVGEDDIVFLDLGPVFEEWETDLGRTFVVGDDPLKHKLRRAIETAFAKGLSDMDCVDTAEPGAEAFAKSWRGIAMSTKIAIVGAGHVGSTTPFALLLSGLASE